MCTGRGPIVSYIFICSSGSEAEATSAFLTRSRVLSCILEATSKQRKCDERQFECQMCRVSGFEVPQSNINMTFLGF